MGVYTNRARRTRAADTAVIVADSPTIVTRSREAFTDKLRASTVATAGPYTVRIEPFRASRSAVTFDEKGTVAASAYVCLGVGLPRYQDTAEKVATFAVGDLLVDTNKNRYLITSPPYWADGVCEFNLELRG